MELAKCLYQGIASGARGWFGVNATERVERESDLFDIPGAVRAVVQVTFETPLVTGLHRVLDVVGHQLDRLLAGVVAEMSNDLAQLAKNPPAPTALGATG